MKKTEQKVGQDKKYDPFNVFGHGIKAYVDLIQVLVFTFLALTLLYLPVLGMNTHGGGLQRHPDYWLKQFSLGNWGQKESKCFH